MLEVKLCFHVPFKCRPQLLLRKVALFRTSFEYDRILASFHKSPSKTQQAARRGREEWRHNINGRRSSGNCELIATLTIGATWALIRTFD